MNLKNKFFIIFFILLIFICFSTSSFCSYDININNNEYKFPDEFGNHPYKLFLYDNSVGHFSYAFVSCDTPFTVVQNLDGNYIFSSQSSFYRTSFSTGSSGVVFDDVYDFSSSVMSLEDNFNTFYKSYIFAFSADENLFYYTSHDIKDNEDNVVFPSAPSLQVMIPKIQQVEEIPQVMEQVMKILIPVGLIVFSIGLVIYLTRLVISRVQ